MRSKKVKKSSKALRRGVRSFSPAKRRTTPAQGLLPGMMSPDEQAELDALEALHKREREALRRKFSNREKKFRDAVKSFRPKKSERGKIVFIGANGKRGAGKIGRKGYVIYVTKTGKKQGIRQRSKGKVASPIARQLSSIDVSRVRNKTARKKFLTAQANAVSRGTIEKIPEKRTLKNISEKTIPKKGTIYAGETKAKNFWTGSSAVEILAKELQRCLNGQRSKKTFLVTIGLVVKTNDGTLRFFSTQQRINRQDIQKSHIDEMKQYFGLVIYAFLAKELAMSGLVMAGSARHISRLKSNKGKPRHKWQKDGFLWQGHDMNDCEVVKVEYRFDHLTFNK